MGKDVTRSCSDAGPKPLPYLPGFNRVHRKIEEKEAEFLPKKMTMVKKQICTGK